jgi:hypothetical protein
MPMILIINYLTASYNALIIIAGSIVLTKLSPPLIEASTYALYTSFYHFSFDFLREFLGSIVSKAFNVTTTNL